MVRQFGHGHGHGVVRRKGRACLEGVDQLRHQPQLLLGSADEQLLCLFVPEAHQHLVHVFGECGVAVRDKFPELH